jgi:hypothetical protein
MGFGQSFPTVPLKGQLQTNLPFPWLRVSPRLPELSRHFRRAICNRLRSQSGDIIIRDVLYTTLEKYQKFIYITR